MFGIKSFTTKLSKAAYALANIVFAVCKMYCSTNFLRTRRKWRTHCELLFVPIVLSSTFSTPRDTLLSFLESGIMPIRYFFEENTIPTELQLFIEKTDWRWFATANPPSTGTNYTMFASVYATLHSLIRCADIRPLQYNEAKNWLEVHFNVSPKIFWGGRVGDF